MTTGAIITETITIALFRLGNLYLKISIITVVAYTTSYCVYWSPVWFGATDDQYSSWAPMLIHLWFIIGIAAGCVTLFVSGRIKDNSKRES